MGPGINVSDTEKRIKKMAQAIEAIKEVQITGIRVRDHRVRMHTSAEKGATLLWSNNRWVNEVVDGAQTRGEEWHPIKIGDVIRGPVVKEDGYYHG